MNGIGMFSPTKIGRRRNACLLPLVQSLNVASLWRSLQQEFANASELRKTRILRHGVFGENQKVSEPTDVWWRCASALSSKHEKKGSPVHLRLAWNLRNIFSCHAMNYERSRAISMVCLEQRSISGECMPFAKTDSYKPWFGFSIFLRLDQVQISFRDRFMESVFVFVVKKRSSPTRMFSRTAHHLPVFQNPRKDLHVLPSADFFSKEVLSRIPWNSKYTWNPTMLFALLGRALHSHHRGTRRVELYPKKIVSSAGKLSETSLSTWKSAQLFLLQHIAEIDHVFKLWNRPTHRDLVYCLFEGDFECFDSYLFGHTKRGFYPPFCAAGEQAPSHRNLMSACSLLLDHNPCCVFLGIKLRQSSPKTPAKRI
jgi:hypothetical protein